MGMDLSQGGHLTHGSPGEHVGQELPLCLLRRRARTGRIDYNEVEKAVKKTRPKMVVAGASAYPPGHRL